MATILENASFCPKELITVERVCNISRLESIRNKWDSLLEKNSTNSVDLSYEWQITHWQYFNKNAELFVLLVSEAGSLVAIAPLKLIKKKYLGASIRCLEFIAAHDSNYQDFIIGQNNERIIECILNFLVKTRDLWDLLNLTHVPQLSPTIINFQKRPINSLMYRIGGIEKCLFLRTNIGWEAYASESKTLRVAISKRMKRLRKLGEIKTLNCQLEEEYIKYINTLIELHRKRWNPTETPSQFNDIEYCNFYKEVTTKLSRKGQVDLFVVFSGENAVALLYSFLLGKNCLLQLIAYDIDFGEGSPSMVMYELFVQQGFKGKFDIIDFGSYHPYKEYWANLQKYRINIEVYNKGLLTYLIYFAKKSKSSLLAIAEDNPFIIKYLRIIRGKARLYYRRLRRKRWN